MEISTILDQIDLGAMALPEFQRGYVWNRNQVHGLFSIWLGRTSYTQTLVRRWHYS